MSCKENVSKPSAPTPKPSSGHSTIANDSRSGYNPPSKNVRPTPPPPPPKKS